MIISPTMVKKLKNFRHIKRGYYSFIMVCVAVVLSLFAEFFANHKALVVKYEGDYYFPVLRAPMVGEDLGMVGSYTERVNEVNYRELKERWKDHSDNFVIMPLVPYSPQEIDQGDHYNEEGSRLFFPLPPRWDTQHYLGTDSTGRDVLSRLIYGFRLSILFALALTLVSILIGVSVGCLMGYLGGVFDILCHRAIEIFASVPSLFVVIIIGSIFVIDIFVMFCIFVVWSWISFVFDTRSLTYREKARNYVLAARAMGASHKRIMFKHLIPNTFVVVLVVIPFSVTGGITSLTSLDYLGYGLGAGNAMSLGQMIREGQALWQQSPWILGSSIALLVWLLISVTFVGEALRESFDPKKYTVYE